MARGKPVHVVPQDGRWAVKREGNQRASSLHDTQAEAEGAGRPVAAPSRRSSTFMARTVRSVRRIATATIRTHRRMRDDVTQRMMTLDSV